MGEHPTINCATRLATVVVVSTDHLDHANELSCSPHPPYGRRRCSRQGCVLAGLGSTNLPMQSIYAGHYSEVEHRDTKIYTIGSSKHGYYSFLCVSYNIHVP